MALTALHFLGEDAAWVALIHYLSGESTLCQHRKRKQIISLSVDDFVDFDKRLRFWRTPSVANVASQSTFSEMGSKLSLFNV